MPGATSFQLQLPTGPAGARLLAGHANAARGRTLLWIIGAGTAGQRRKTSLEAVRAWFSDALNAFEAPTPEPELLPLQVDGAELVLAHIPTARAPFVLRPRGSRPGEVAWFDAAAGKVRSATRLDLVRLVTPLAELPQFEILEAELTFYRNAQARSRTTFRWTLDASMYLLPRGQDRLILPLHRLRAELSVGDWTGRAAEVHVTADRQSPSIRVTESAVLADGLGRFFFYCAGTTEREALAWDEPARFLAEFLPAGAELAALARGELPREAVLEANQVARWKSA